MRKTFTLLAAVAAAAAAPAFAADAPAAAAAAAPAGKLSVADTDLGTLLDNPASKAVLAKYVNEMISNPQIDMARSMTLKQLQQYAGDSLTDTKLALIQADLDKLPAK